MIERLRNDFRFGLRLLTRDPGFSLIAIAVLALGIGATTSIFTVVNGILLQPLPFPESDRLVMACEENPRLTGYCVASASNVRDWQEESETLDAMGAARSWPLHARVGEERFGVSGGVATAEFFTALGMQPLLGRLFEPGEVGSLDPHGNAVGAEMPHVAVLSHQLWVDRFGGDTSAVGRSIGIDGESFTVVGVLPEAVEVPELEFVRLWLPFPFDRDDPDTRGWRGFLAIGRMAPDVAIEEVQAELRTLQAGLTEAYPEANEGWSISTHPLLDFIVGDIRATLLLFLGAVGLVLLIACLNIANLLLVRSARRDTEFAVRSAVGAEESHIARQIFTEGALLSLIAGALGTLLALWATDVFLSMAPSEIPRVNEVRLDVSVILFALAVSLGTSFIFSLGPLFRMRRIDLRGMLQLGRPGTAGRVGSGFRRGLVVAELAMALILLVTAGLLLRSFLGFISWDPGFETRRLLTVSAFAPPATYTTSAEVGELWRQSEEELVSIPGIRGVSTASAGPLFGGVETSAFQIEGQPAADPEQRPTARWFDVGPDYFRVMGIPLLAGRGLAETDVRAAPPVAVINRTMARRYWPAGSPVGERIELGEGGRNLEIVGVVDAVRPIEPGRAPRPEIYWSNRQAPRWGTFFVIRSEVEPTAVVEAIRARLKTLEPDLDLGTFRTMDDLVARSVVRPRFNATLVGAFAVIALVLASVGLYGVISYAVSTRSHEIGVRIALGADSREVVKSFLREAAFLVLFGLLLGLAGAVVLSGLVSSLLFGVDPTDVPTYLVTGLLLAAIALTACVIPALRASRIDPVQAMRIE